MEESENVLKRIKELMKLSPEGREAIIEIEQLQSEGVSDNDILEAFKLIVGEVFDEKHE